MNYRTLSLKNRDGFTLVELVIVILILGILAAVAAPRLFDTTTDARKNATRQSLAVIRNAIELHRARDGALPGDGGTEADLKDDLKQYIQGQFPASEFGSTGTSVRVQTSGSALTVSGSEAWAYDNKTGEFILNHASGSSW